MDLLGHLNCCSFSSPVLLCTCSRQHQLRNFQRCSTLHTQTPSHIVSFDIWPCLMRPTTFKLIVQQYGILTVPFCGCIMTQLIFVHLLPRGIHVWMMPLYVRHFVTLFFKLPCTWYSNLLRAGESGDRILVGAIFSTPIQNGPGAYQVSYTMGTGFSPRLKKE